MNFKQSLLKSQNTKWKRKDSKNCGKMEEVVKFEMGEFNKEV